MPVPDPDSIRSAMQRYVKLLCDGDVDGILDLYAEEATVEDPVGLPPRQGREAIRNLYGLAAGKLRVELTGPIRVAGRECAMPMLAEIDRREGGKLYVDVIDVMEFDDAGKVVRMRAFWNPAEGRTQP
jgi:steroid delta-isomerase